LPSECNDQSACEPLHGDLATVLERVLASRAFAKTARLSAFLRHICSASAEGRLADLSEQRIGQEVFGRAGHYNPTEDTIVRSTARLLRQRLENYYADEGRHDRWRLTVPRGAYAPVVVSAEGVDAAVAMTIEAWVDSGDREAAPPQGAPAAPTAALSAPPAPPRRAPGRAALLGRGLQCRLRRALRMRGRGFWALAMALGCAAALVTGLAAFSLPTPASTALKDDALWAELFESSRDTLLVAADSNLVMYQLEVLHEVPLEDYIAKRIAPHPGGADVKFLKNRHTSISTVGFAVELGKLAGSRQVRLQTRYARDLLLDELKQSNVILLGVRQANPWVELFRDRFNFHIDWDISTEKFLVRNDQPLADEQAVYEFSKDDPKRRGYAHIAFTRGLGGAGHMLLVSGTNAGGTEAAQEFILDARRMKPVLERARRRDGHIGDFEMLVQCMLRAGGSTDVQLLALRTGRT